MSDIHLSEIPRSMIRYLAAGGNVLVKVHRSVLDSGCIGLVIIYI